MIILNGIKSSIPTIFPCYWMTNSSYSAWSRYLHPEDHSFRRVVGGAPCPQGGIFIRVVYHMVSSLWII